MCVMARGCGIDKLLSKFIQYYSYGTVDSPLSQEENKKLVFVLNLAGKEQLVLDNFLADGIPPHRLPHVVTSESASTNERSEMYSNGGCFIITSRLLIVDLLDNRVPKDSILGILVANAHTLTETSSEAFILRVYRERHRSGFIKAFTEDPESLTGSFGKIDRTMRLLWLQKMYLWPRFHEKISSFLKKSEPEVIETFVPLNQPMKVIQASLLVCLNATIQELKRAVPTLDTSYMNLQNGIFPNFDRIVQQQLDPVWHTLNSRTIQLKEDLKTIRELVMDLIRYDAVSFLYKLQSVRKEAMFRDMFKPSLWLSSEAADVVFKIALDRVFVTAPLPGNGKSSAATCSASETKSMQEFEHQLLKDAGLTSRLVPTVEAPPKWKVLVDTVMGEIHRAYLHRKGELQLHAQQRREILEMFDQQPGVCDESTPALPREKLNGRILIVFKDEDTLLRLRDCLSRGVEDVVKKRFRYWAQQNSTDIMKKAVTSVKSDGKPQTKSGDLDYLSMTPAQKAALSHEQKMILIEHTIWNLDQQEQNSRADRKRRAGGDPLTTRAKKAPKEHSGAGVSLLNLGDVLSQDDEDLTGKVLQEELHLILLTHRQAADRAQLLSEVDPFAVVLYDPEVSMVRRLELFQIQKQQEYIENCNDWSEFVSKMSEKIQEEKVRFSARQLSKISELSSIKYPRFQRIKVHFLMYKDSVDEHHYTASLGKEKKAFESLIVSKGKLAVCLPDLPRDILELKTANETYSMDSRTVNRGTNKKVQSTKIIVDGREFRSSLPSILHADGMNLVARSLIVGDYVLSPEICVERKSISDLIGSFNNGRLYKQCVAMSTAYRHPCLLIEFTEQQSFSFQASTDLSDYVDEQSIQSKIATLAIAFPSLRLLWSRSPHCTTDIFKAIMAGHEEVDEGKAVTCGASLSTMGGGAGVDEDEARSTARDMLLRLPGINQTNVYSVIDGCENLADLASRSEIDLQSMIGPVNARTLWNFLTQEMPI